MYVGLGLQEHALHLTPARWLTLTGLAWVAALITAIMTFATAVLAVMGRDVSLFLVPQALAYTCMGCVLLARRPGHPMGPLLCLIGLAIAISQVPFVYARYALVHSPGSLPFSTAMLWMNTWAYAPAISLAGLVLPMVFPEGRLLSPRWRPALWAALAFIPLFVAGYAFIPQSMGSLFRNLPDPYTVSRLDGLFKAMQVLAVTCGLAAAAAAVASVTLRWRRADRVRRQQLKWFLAVMPIAVVSFVVTLVAPGPWSLGIGLVSGTLTPVAIGIAVLRYRLYEIDILISRTVLYALLTAGVAAVYLGVVTIAYVVFRVHGRDLRIQVLATALGAAALFPLRDRVQRRVERLFYATGGYPTKPWPGSAAALRKQPTQNRR